MVIDLIDDDGSPFDATGYDARASLRRYYTSTDSIDFTCDLDTEASTLTLSLTPDQTAVLVVGRYVYDAEIFIDEDTTVYRVAQGFLFVDPNVTRPPPPPPPP